ncbi:MAG: potassium channel family protein [Pseudomonadales bacterium]|nr:potassium channel family protein [Pseudomonadales bacterium]
MLKITLVNSFIVALVVMIHYEALFRLTTLMPAMQIRHRIRIVLGVFGALIAHAVEVWVFALAYYLMDHSEGWGHLEGNFDHSLLDSVYFSFTTFSTLGFGDIQPIGHLRYLTGIEALTGLVLITWTASFLFLEMQRYWHSK